MKNSEHAQRIIDSLEGEHGWENIIPWHVEDKKTKYDLIFTSENKDVVMHYEIDPMVAPGIISEGLATGNFGPTFSSSKMVDKFEAEYIAGLPRRTRRKLERKLKKEKYRNKR